MSKFKDIKDKDIYQENIMISIAKTQNQLLTSHISAKAGKANRANLQNSQAPLAKSVSFGVLAANRLNVGFKGNVDVQILGTEIQFDDYKDAAGQVIDELKQRKGKPGQFLNWIKILPEGQLKEIDRIYGMANEVPGHDKIDDLVVIGIGGSKHTTEAMLDLVDIEDRKVNVHLYSAIDDDSFEKMKRKINPKRTLFLIVSKSGTTLETMTGYEKFRELTDKTVGAEDAKNHFIAMTDKRDKSKLNCNKI